MRRSRRRLVVSAAAIALAVATLSTVALAAATGAFRSRTAQPGRACAVPSLPGTVVNVTVTDMGDGMMGAGPMTGNRTASMMRVHAGRQSVAAGVVSLRVANTGGLTHELIVLPLPAGQHVGQRSVGADGRIDETGAVGEASRTCGEGEGEGIDAGSVGWTTLQLAPGDYELVCNLPGHYAAGMYTKLHVHA